MDMHKWTCVPLLTPSLFPLGTFDSTLARNAFESTGRNYEAVLYSEMQPSLRNTGIEGILNEALSGSLGMQGVSATLNNGLSRVGLSREFLTAAGLTPQQAERMYKMLYIHSFSMQDGVEDLLREADPAARSDLLLVRSTDRSLCRNHFFY